MTKKSKPKEVLQHPATADEWKTRLKNSCMAISFNLHLTKTMLEMLCAISDDVWWDRHLYWKERTVPENWIATVCALEKRGLIERKPPEWFEENKHKKYESWEQSAQQSHNVLTPAGSLVIELVKMAGMFVESDNAINKKFKKA